MLMHNSPHSGKVIRRILIDSTGLSMTEVAKNLDVTRVNLSKIINGKSGISPEMAVRLSLLLNTSSEMWMNMQTIYNLWQTENK